MSENKCEVCEKNLVLDEENICAQCELNENKEETVIDVNCGICHSIVEEDSEGINCDRCNCWYHNDCSEDPLIEDLFGLLNKAPNNVKWFCDKCIWETEKWIKSYKVVRGRPKKVKVRDSSDKNDVVENNDNCDQEKESEVKSELHSDNDSIGFEDSQDSDYDAWLPEDDENKEKPNKKKRRSSQDSDYDAWLPEDDENKEKPKKNRRRKSINKSKPNTKDSLYKRKTYYCDLCTRGFNKPENLDAHKLWHSGDMKPFKCTMCDQSFSKKHRLKVHIEQHSSDETFICEICAKEFKVKSNLERHHKNMHSDNPYTCSMCDYKSGSKSLLNSHIIHKHSEEKSFKCKECVYSSATESGLKLHFSQNHGEKTHICEKCNKAFSHKYLLLRHHMKFHTDNKPTFPCTKCDAKFTTKSYLKLHMRIHTGEMYDCTICDYKTINKTTLSCHMLTHSGEKPFVCDVCGKQVRDARSLKQHTLLHTGEKPLKCEICGKQFRAPGTLRVHMMYHNKIMKHRCPECGYGAPTRDKMTLHIRTVHSNETPYECDMCGNRYKTKGNLSKHKRGVRGSCQGANGVKNPKQQKLSDTSQQNKQKQELFEFSDQESVNYRVPLQAFSEQAQIKPKYASQQQYQGPASSIQITIPQSYQNLLLYTEAPNNNSNYLGGLLPSSST